MSKIPNIRFKGFSDSWEQRKLGEVAKFKQGTQVDLENQYIENASRRVRFIRIVDYTQGTHDIRYIDEVENANNVDLYDVVVVRYGATAGFIGRGIAGIIANNMFTINPIEAITKDYLYVFMKQDKIYKILNYNNGSSAMPAINFNVMSKLDISYPDISEQKIIGDCFGKLDNLITLHQRKCDETKELKKYMLQKFFPKKDCNIPEIRFNGFTDAWEQRKLEDVVERVTRKNKDLASELPLTISAQYGLIDQNEFFDKRVASKDVSGYYLIKKGEFAYNKSTSNDAPWGAIKRLDRYENGVLSTLYIVFKIIDENINDSNFLATYYDTCNWHKDVQAIAAEGARNHGLLNISPADFFKTKLMLPKDIKEQKEIGTYFKNLDNLITLHQRKCEELKEMKKYMLSNMFPKGE